MIEVIRDPIHGFIKLSDIEKSLIDTIPFQRLRNIKQLALTNYVYPAAEHSRFSHCIGVMEFTSKIFDVLVQKDKKKLKSELAWSEDDFVRNRQLIRLAALLHDLGHAPFSHASEDLIEDGMDHEQFTPKIIRSNLIQPIIEKYVGQTGITTEDVAEFFDDDLVDTSKLFLKPIFAGEVDSDKMDYLLRDSLFTGVSYGKFDHERLLMSLCLIEDPNPENKDQLRVAIEEGGVHALEGMVLARYFMFTQVYFHRVRRAYDLHLLNFLKYKIGKYPSSVDEYVKWDDKKVMGEILLDSNSNRHGEAILYRKHFKEAFHSPDHTDFEGRKRFYDMKKEVLKRFDENDLFFDEAKKAPHNFGKIDFFVKLENEKIDRIENQSGIIKKLDTIEQYRIYADSKIRNDVKKFCNEYFENQIELASNDGK